MGEEEATGVDRTLGDIEEETDTGMITEEIDLGTIRETGMEMIQGINLGMIRGTEKEKKAGEKGRWRGVTGDFLDRGKRRVDGIDIVLILKFPLFPSNIIL